MIPRNLKFTKTHEWAGMDDNGVVTVGISEYAVNQLGDVVFIELPSVGDQVKQQSAFGAIESVKAAVELNSPVSGKVVEINEDITENFDPLSQDTYGQAWLIKVEASDQSQLDALMSAGDYQNYLDSDDCD